MSDALDDGADAALAAIKPFVDHVETLSDEDKGRWWTGFSLAVQGMVTHSLDAEMALMISRACSELAQEDIDEQRTKS